MNLPIWAVELKCLGEVRLYLDKRFVMKASLLKAECLPTGSSAKFDGMHALLPIPPPDYVLILFQSIALLSVSTISDVAI